MLSRRASGVVRLSTPRLVVHCSVMPDLAAAPQADVVGLRRSRAPRVGFIVSKAVGNSVVRHRVTRKLRAVVAERIDHLPNGTDLVLRALPAAAGASSSDFSGDLDQALRKAL